MYTLSIVIPTLNEEGNIRLLLERIKKTCLSHNITYEVICIDDHSSDLTREVIQQFQQENPEVRLYTKQGDPGKAQSLIEGFQYAQYDLISMIDADLQYPPEAIPKMMRMMDRSDIVVANREEQQVSFRRKVISKTFYLFFGKFLHGLDCDVQSGLKLFRRDVARRIKLHPSPWTFDLEFLLKARNAGYKISTVDITFSKRHTGRAKISLIRASWEIGTSALAAKFKTPEMIPFLPEDIAKHGWGFHYKGNRFVPHTDLYPRQTAFHRLGFRQAVVILMLLYFLGLSLYVNWHATVTAFVATITVLYFTDLLFNFFLIYRSFSRSPELKIPKEEVDALPDSFWPRYSIFCPLYKEWEVIPQFVTAMSRMDYPKDKLQVILILEEDDRETVEKVKHFDLPSYFEVLVVPDSKPKTKPKACNYALKHATGEYVVIYDAEDVPDTLQMKKAVLGFGKVTDRTVCIQAKLNFYNPHQNLLTRVFTAEYSLWFDLVLTGLQSIGAIIPLGGTSNHFRIADLRRLRGWDSFNVTEDCDLGVRLVKNGFKTAVIDSVTMEEANSDIWNWFGQRSRWIKGYIQTYLVHMRHPSEFLTGWGDWHLITFQLVVGGKVMSMFINPLMWTTTLAYFMFRAQVAPVVEQFFPAPVLYMGIFSLFIGNFLYMYYYMIGCAKRDQDEIMKYAFLVPLYWLCMSIAAWKAVIQMFYKPHHWSKTKHGLHLHNAKAMTQATTTIGEDLVDNKITRLGFEPAIG